MRVVGVFVDGYVFCRQRVQISAHLTVHYGYGLFFKSTLVRVCQWLIQMKDIL